MQHELVPKPHIDYRIGDFETNGNEICFDKPYKTDHVASLILTNIKCEEKNMPKTNFIFKKIIINEKWSFAKLYPLFNGFNYIKVNMHKTCFQ